MFSKITAEKSSNKTMNLSKNNDALVPDGSQPLLGNSPQENGLNTNTNQDDGNPQPGPYNNPPPDGYRAAQQPVQNVQPGPISQPLLAEGEGPGDYNSQKQEDPDQLNYNYEEADDKYKKKVRCLAIAAIITGVFGIWIGVGLVAIALGAIACCSKNKDKKQAKCSFIMAAVGLGLGLAGILFAILVIWIIVASLHTASKAVAGGTNALGSLASGIKDAGDKTVHDLGGNGAHRERPPRHTFAPDSNFPSFDGNGGNGNGGNGGNGNGNGGNGGNGAGDGGNGNGNGNGNPDDTNNQNNQKGGGASGGGAPAAPDQFVIPGIGFLKKRLTDNNFDTKDHLQNPDTDNNSDKTKDAFPNPDTDNNFDNTPEPN